MRLNIEQWKQNETTRTYLTGEVRLTEHLSGVSWSKEKTPVFLELTEREEDFAVGIFSINAIRAATFGPFDLQIVVEQPEQWEEIEPRVLDLLGQLAGADEVTMFPSPQNPDQY